MGSASERRDRELKRAASSRRKKVKLDLAPDAIRKAWTEYLKTDGSVEPEEFLDYSHHAMSLRGCSCGARGAISLRTTQCPCGAIVASREAQRHFAPRSVPAGLWLRRARRNVTLHPAVSLPGCSCRRVRPHAAVVP